MSLFATGATTNVYATSTPCRNLTECREDIREVRENIAEIVEEEAVLSGEISVIQRDVDNLRNEISILGDTLRGLETQFEQLSDEITDLAEEMEENLEILHETQERIEILIEEVARRMRITQRMNNQNSILALLGEAESLIDFMRTARTFSQIAAEDSENMNELTQLMEFQDELLMTLESQYETLAENRNILKENITEREVEQARMYSMQSELSTQQLNLLEQMYRLGLNRVDEEQRLAALEEAEEALYLNPPRPAVTVTPPPPPPTTNNNSTASNDTPAPPPPPAQSTGLAHPLPGARVSSEFGPRWGGWHAGIDVEIFSQPSAPILAAASGTVTHSTFESGMGWYVVISHDINGQRVDTLYGHLRYQPLVSVGDTVSQGQQIGVKGSTGFSTGPHLHFEVHPGGFRWNAGVEPRHWINF